MAFDTPDIRDWDGSQSENVIIAISMRGQTIYHQMNSTVKNISAMTDISAA
jgi:hypothetical protein